MDFGRIVQMLVKRMMRRAVTKGIAKGVSLAASKGKPAQNLIATEGKQPSSARQTAKRARQAARITRRLGR